MNTSDFIATMSTDPHARAAWIAAIATADISCDRVDMSGARISGVRGFVVDGTNLDSVVATMMALRADGLLCENADAALNRAKWQFDYTSKLVNSETIATDAYAQWVANAHLRKLALACALSCVPADDEDIDGVGITVDGREIPASL